MSVLTIRKSIFPHVRKSNTVRTTSLELYQKYTPPFYRSIVACTMLLYCSDNIVIKCRMCYVIATRVAGSRDAATGTKGKNDRQEVPTQNIFVLWRECVILNKLQGRRSMTMVSCMCYISIIMPFFPRHNRKCFINNRNRW